MPDSDEAAERRRDFGRRLREKRESVGMTQTAVAKAARMDRSFYVEIETGRHSVSVERLYDIATALGVSLSDLFAEDPPPRP